MAALNVWGNVGNEAFALPMVKLTPAIPSTQAYLLGWSIADQALDYLPATLDSVTGNMAVTGDFSVATGKVYKIGTFQVVGARKTGWVAPTGTATRTAFATTTVTLPQLAEALKALIDDLTLHGLIGT